MKAQFETALNTLNETNQMLCDYWMSELCDENGDLMDDKLTEKNYNLIENDVLAQELKELDYPDESYIMDNDFAD
jgi:hypothetical protein